MKILTWDTPNFGDRLNDWVWEQYIPHLLDDDADDLLVGIGSLLNHRLPKKPAKNIFGSGVGHGDLPNVDASWRVLWLRGPLSAKTLNLDPSYVITDGAVLLGDLITPANRKEYQKSFIPHTSACHSGAEELLVEGCEQAGIHFISPNWPAQRVIEDIGKSQFLLTEALHGAITADALRVPWAPLSRKGILDYKWHDWMQSMDLNYRPTKLVYRPQWFSTKRHERLSRRLAFSMLRPSSRALLYRQLAHLKVNAHWMLSDVAILSGKIKRITKLLKDL